MSFKHPLLGELDRQTAVDVDLVKAQTYDIMQFKYDGIWSGVSRIAAHTSQARIQSRNGLVKEHIELEKLPINTIIVGEFMFGSQWAQNSERLGKVYCFDLLCLDGEDLRTKPYQFRYAALKDLLHIINHPRLPIVNCYSGTNIERTIVGLKRNRVYEGIVTRNWNQTYEEEIGRYKMDIEDDFVVMSILPGEGKHTGRAGSMAVGQYLGDQLVEIMTVGGGMNDDLRQLMWNYPQRYIGRVARISGKMRFESGAFRHPNLENFRDDKYAKECKLLKHSSSVTTE